MAGHPIRTIGTMSQLRLPAVAIMSWRPGCAAMDPRDFLTINTTIRQQAARFW